MEKHSIEPSGPSLKEYRRELHVLGEVKAFHLWKFYFRRLRYRIELASNKRQISSTVDCPYAGLDRATDRCVVARRVAHALNSSVPVQLYA